MLAIARVLPWYLVGAVMAGIALAGQDPCMEAYLASEGKLRSALELRDAQAGFAGVVEDVFRIAPDGRYTIGRYLGEKSLEPARGGLLGPAELKFLASVLDAEDFLGLPAELGAGPAINARRITLRFGEKEASLLLMPGEAPGTAAQTASGASRGPVARFAAIFEAVKASLARTGQPGGAPPNP